MILVLSIVSDVIFFLVHINTSPITWYIDSDISYTFNLHTSSCFFSVAVTHIMTERSLREKIYLFCTFRSHLGKFKEGIQAGIQKPQRNASF